MSYGAEIRVAVAGLEKLKLLEDRVSQLQGRFTKLNAAIANLGKVSQPKVNIDTRMAERQIAGLRRQIQSLNTGTTTVKVRTVFENSGSGSGNRGNGVAAAAAAGAFGGFSSAGSMAAMRRISDTLGGSSGSGGSSGLARVSRDLNSWKDSLDDASGLTGRHRREIEALRGAYGKANRELRTYDAQIEVNQQETAQLTTQIAALKSKISSTGGLNNTFADELRKDIEAASARLEQLQKELTSTNLFSPGLNFQRDRTAGIAGEYSGISDRVQERQKLELQQQKLEAARNRLPRGSGVIGNALGSAATLVGTYAGVSGLQQLGQSAIQRSTADLGLKANTEQLGEYQQATKAVAEQVKLLGLSQTEATNNFTQAYAALRPLGLQLETVNKLQQGFVATARASGRSVEEATSSWRQYVQAIGKGRLNGDELVSIQENAPQLYQQLAKELKVNVGALKDLGEEGKITSDVLVKAGLALRDSSLTKLEKILQGPEQQLKNLSNEFENLGVALGEVFGPALGQELKNAVAGVKAFTGWIQTLTPAQGKLIVETVKLAAQLFLVSKAIQAIQGAGAVIGFLRTLAATQVAVGTTAGGATVLVNGLALALSRLAAIGVVTVGFKWLGDAKAAGDQIEALSQRLQNGGTGKTFSPQTNSREQILEAQKAARQTTKAAQAELDRLKKESSGWMYSIPGLGAAMAGMQGSRAQTLVGRILDAQSVLQLKPDQFQTQAQRSQAELAGLLQGVPVPGTDPKDTKKAADDARKAAEALAADRAQLDKALAQNAINLDNTVFQNRQNQLQQQYELERQLQQKTADNWSLGFTGAGRDQAGLINQLNSNLQGYGDKIKELQGQIAAAEQRVKAAKAGVGVAQIQPATVLPMGAGAGAGRLPGSISGRLDASGQNGGDMPVGVNNAIRSYHNGVVKELGRAGNNGNYVVVEFLDDLGNRLEATYSHLAATVKKGETVIGGQVIGRFDGSGRTFGAHNSVDINSLGNNGAFQRNQETPAARRAADLLIQGKVLGGPGGATASTSASAASPLAGADNVASALGDVTTAEAELQGLNDQLKQLQAGLGGLKQADVTGFILQSTDAFRSQAAELKNGTAQLELRSMLEAKGMSNGYIEAEVQKLAVSQDLAQRLEALKAALDNALISQDAFTVGAVALANAAGQAATALDAQGAAADKADRLLKQQQEIRDLYNGIGDELRNGVVNGLVMAASATDRLGESMQNLAGDILNAIGKALILNAITGALGGLAGDDGVGFFSILAGKFGKRAAGGPVNAGAPYLVGEEGPELILPQRNGYVLNADQTQDALAQSRGALAGPGTTSSDAAFSENRDALSSVTTATRERQMERWITSGASSTEIKYSRVGSGDLPFITEEDALQIARVATQEGARLGQQRTMSALKNNPGARRTIGI